METTRSTSFTTVDAIRRPRRRGQASSCLDLNLPGTDGRDVLVEIKREQTLADIPVVVLTTSSDRRDVTGCYQAGANSYVQKPVDLDGFMEAIQRLHDYWFDVAILPDES
jgi:two-component system response regulator